MSHEPRVKLLVPANHEGNWSDLLGALIETDPLPMSQVLGLAEDDQIQVSRERTVSWKDSNNRTRTDRVDLVLTSLGHDALVVIEAKVLAPVGRDQLQRYAQSIPASQYRLLQLRQFEVPPSASKWQTLTWDEVLDAYTQSQHAWAATTARAWLEQLAQLIPAVDGSTVWKDVRDEADGDIDLRARGAWLHSQMPTWCSISHGFSATTGGRSWVVEMEAPTSRPNLSVAIEMDEALPVRQWNCADGDPPRSERLKGPTILLGLLQREIEDTRSFDWQLLRRLFKRHVLDAKGVPLDGRAWRKGSAQRSHLAGWRNHVGDKANVPNWLGQGYDMSKHGWCLFGARFNLGPTLTLDDVMAELQRTESFIRQLADDV